jgi:hypothetical protein
LARLWQQFRDREVISDFPAANFRLRNLKAHPKNVTQEFKCAISLTLKKTGSAKSLQSISNLIVWHRASFARQSVPNQIMRAAGTQKSNLSVDSSQIRKDQPVFQNGYSTVTKFADFLGATLCTGWCSYSLIRCTSTTQILNFGPHENDKSQNSDVKLFSWSTREGGVAFKRSLNSDFLAGRLLSVFSFVIYSGSIAQAQNVPLSKIIYSNDRPIAPAIQFDSFAFGRPSIDSSDNVGFSARLLIGSGGVASNNRETVFVGTSSGVTLVSRTGTAEGAGTPWSIDVNVRC